MAVAHSIFSQSHASGSQSVSQASFTWNHTGTTNPNGVLIFLFQTVSGTDVGGVVTYGGTTVPAVTGGFATDAATEPGSVKAYFLGSGIPTTDNAAVVVNRTNNTTGVWATCISVVAATDTEVYLPGIVLVQGDAAVAEQSVTDGSTGVNSERYAGVYYGGATPAPAGANSTLLGTVNDLVALGHTCVRRTSVGQGAQLVGCTQGTSDDQASVHLAVREVVLLPVPDVFMAPLGRAS